MQASCNQSQQTMRRIGGLLEAVKQIDVDEVEDLVQLAHECDVRSVDAPTEPLPLTRQALRMFWMFRRNIETVEVKTEHA